MNEAVKNAQADAMFMVFEMDTRTKEEGALRVQEFLLHAQGELEDTREAFSWWFPQPELAVVDGSDNYPFEVHDRESAGNRTNVLVAVEVEGAELPPNPLEVGLGYLRGPQDQTNWPDDVLNRLGPHSMELVEREGHPSRFVMTEADPVLNLNLDGQKMVLPIPPEGADTVLIALSNDRNQPVTGFEVHVEDGVLQEVEHGDWSGPDAQKVWDGLDRAKAPTGQQHLEARQRRVRTEIQGSGSTSAVSAAGPGMA